jgi:uncharacterized membrane protein
MAEQKFCQDCDQERDCQEVYKQLGDRKDASVVFKVIVAFLLPLVVFIVSLAIFEEILAEAVNTKELRTVVSFLVAVLISFICILIVQVIDRQLR